MSESKYALRPYQSEDAPALLQLFLQTVRNVNSRDYAPAQIAAWAPQDRQLKPWADRFNGHIAWVAVHNQQHVGFADMTTEGYLDRLFVSHQHQRQGIARLLLEKMFAEARNLELLRMTTEASITARPFFESMGFSVILQQQVECRGVFLTNFQMQCPL